MTIHDLAASHLKAGGPLRPKELNGSKEKGGPKAVGEGRGPDKVEISDEAKLLAAQARQRRAARPQTTCRHCGVDFIARRGAKFCSTRCRVAAHRQSKKS